METCLVIVVVPGFPAVYRLPIRDGNGLKQPEAAKTQLPFIDYL